MCVLVQLVDIDSPTWDRNDVAIYIPHDLTSGQALLIARRILAELGTPQPAESTMEAVCFCGQPVKVHGALPTRRPALHTLLERFEMVEVSRGA